MLRIIASHSADAAKQYFTSSLERGDYYHEGSAAAIGRWGGIGARRLGLAGAVTREQFAALCDNRTPDSSARLTARTRGNRRVGYDINFHAPKSLSLLHALTKDESIERVFALAVEETMQAVEAEAKTRVRLGGSSDDRTTANLVWATFIHDTTRPIDGIPDPHLHAHCFTFNATYDVVENRWKALQLGSVKRDGAFFEAFFHACLASGVRELGYQVERRGRFWEVADIPRILVDKFSKRTAEIERVARLRGIEDPEKKAALGQRTRSSKAETLPRDAVQDAWHSRLSASDLGALQGATAGRHERRSTSPTKIVAAALESSFERASVVTEREVMEKALRMGIGQFKLEELSKALSQTPLIRREIDGQRLLTTAEILAEERAVIAFARAGRNSCAPLRKPSKCDEPALSVEQRRAVEHVLASTDRVTVIRGAAGTGKTTMMSAAVRGLESAGWHVTVLAPTASASRGTLRSHGFKAADTVARFLNDAELQADARNGVVWIDEAGLLGVRTLHALFKATEALNARLVLSGDYRQHGPVERGDALRILESEAGLRWAELSEIRRQKRLYKAAIEDLSEGRTREGFERIEALGAIVEAADPVERYERVAASVLDDRRRGRSSLVVSPTHAEGRAATAAIRTALKEHGIIGKARPLHALYSHGWTQLERQDPARYSAGDVVQFHKHARGFRAGDRLTVSAIDAAEGSVFVCQGEKQALLPLRNADRFDVFERCAIGLGRGDLVRITKNGRTLDGRSAVHNGTIHRLAGFTANGDLVLGDGRTLSRTFEHIDHGYCVTSHAAQGSSADRVILVQSAASYRASSDAQFYVSASRGKKEILIVTDDTELLLRAVQQHDARTTASELVRLGVEFDIPHRRFHEREHRHEDYPHDR